MVANDDFRHLVRKLPLSYEHGRYVLMDLRQNLRKHQGL